VSSGLDKTGLQHISFSDNTPRM